MRTSIDIPDSLMKKAKVKAIEEGISLKELFTRSLEKELADTVASPGSAPWKQLRSQGSADALQPEESGFEGYSGPDWNHAIQVNDPDSP